MFRDFNCVRSEEERIRAAVRIQEIEPINFCMAECGVDDIKLKLMAIFIHGIISSRVWLECILN